MKLILGFGPLTLNCPFVLTHPCRCVEDRDVKSQRQLFYIKAVTLKEVEDKRKEQSNTKQNESCTSGQEEEELNLDSHVVIRYHRGPVLIGQPIRVSVNLRANVSGHFAAIR